jgi:hypothetical protein
MAHDQLQEAKELPAYIDPLNTCLNLAKMVRCSRLRIHEESGWGWGYPCLLQASQQRLDYEPRENEVLRLQTRANVQLVAQIRLVQGSNGLRVAFDGLSFGSGVWRLDWLYGFRSLYGPRRLYLKATRS